MLDFVFRVAGMYFLALIMIRFLGKRALGELGPFDFVVMTGVGDTVISVALDKSMPFYEGVIILITLAALEYLVGWMGLKNGRLSNILSGSPVVLIDNGTIIKKNLAREKFNIDDLMQELRKKGVRDINHVEKGILESCGGFSVILKDEHEPVSRKDLGVKNNKQSNFVTSDQISRKELFQKMQEPVEEEDDLRMMDRLQNIEGQMERILAWIEKLEKAPDNDK